jgi:hypothetical protein
MPATERWTRGQDGGMGIISKNISVTQVAEETAHLAPHGVPSNPIPRALSSSRLHELAGPDQSGYGATYQTTGGNLDIPGQQGG